MIWLLLLCIGFPLALFIAVAFCKAGAIADERQQELFDAKFGAEREASLDERRGQITQDVLTKKGQNDE